MPNENEIKKSAELTFKINTLRHPWERVAGAFADAGLTEHMPDRPSEASAFLAAIRLMDLRGQNPKAHDGKPPLYLDHRVGFKKVNQTIGKTEITANVQVSPATSKGAGAPCVLTLTYRQGSGIVADNGPDRSATVAGKDGSPRALIEDSQVSEIITAFQACYLDCQNVDSEDIRRKVHEILPEIKPFWINGKIVAWYDPAQHDLASRVAKMLRSLGNPAMAYRFDLDADAKAEHAEVFLSSLADAVALAIQDATVEDGARESTRRKKIAELAKVRETLAHYQTLLDVSQDQVAVYLAQLADAEGRIRTLVA